MPDAGPSRCAFCAVASGDAAADVVFEDALSVAFLDRRPVFPGHVLLVPREHLETLADLPAPLVGPFFQNVQLLSRALELGLGVDGSFVAVNNRVSQSVPHLHVHLVPRRRKDGLRGFFWPRSPYPDDATRKRVLHDLRDAVARLSAAPPDGLPAAPVAAKDHPA